jgi:glycosyltransferase involved in cell wall biosynthesis
MKIVILLSVYNGAIFIKQQLDSLCIQTCQNFKAICRDDNSADKSLEILKPYDLKIIPPSINLGAKKSFATLLEYALENTDAEYFMFCDQDDVWEADKIEKTLLKMKEVETVYPSKPILIHTDLQVVDNNMKNIHHSFWKHQKINPNINSLNRLLIQNTITGCSMMINRKLATLSNTIPNESIMHDWWMGLVASQFGHIGVVNSATIKYRQHSSNAVGAKCFDLKFIIKSFFKKINLTKHCNQAKAFLDVYRDDLDKKTIHMLEEFSDHFFKIILAKKKNTYKIQDFQTRFD